MELKVGQKAPDFSLSDQNGVNHSLKKYKGTWILLYFYPKDNTPGCTQEACAIRDSYPDFKKLGITVFGVSTDSVVSHEKFASKFGLPFTLLSDNEKEVIGKYDIWRFKRISFLIDPEGNIAKIYPKVKPAEHAQEVLHDLNELMN